MDTHTRSHDTTSALADGELAAAELELAFAALDTDSGRQVWDAYRHIGDVLRSERRGHVLSAQFDARLAARLAQEVPPHAELLASPSAALVPPGLIEPLEAGPPSPR